MSLQIGQQLGAYQITSLIGKGGMGEVYRAKDTKLKRDVAIKILPDEFSRDTDRVSRFQREAESLAALNHQNIAAIYDLQQSDATRFLILEFVEGDTLADILKKRGALPVEEALEIAKQICEALEAAHEKGIIHRDLKPANVKITPEGRVKVLDFGLAKPLQEASQDLSNSPTLSMATTNAGVILGTAAYMSPEQARGEDTDERSDVFSFGTVLFEMLTGQQAFQGKTVSDNLASVLAREPDFALLPRDMNPRLYELLRRCLDKNPKRRWQAAGDLKIELETVCSGAHRNTDLLQVPGPRNRERYVWMSAIGILSLIIVLVGGRGFRQSPSAPEIRLDINTPTTTDIFSLAVSPDGQKIVYSANSGGSRLWLRSLDSNSVRPLSGTDNSRNPFWSPDSRSIGFFADGKLKRLDIDGGAVQTLAVSAGRGGAWSQDGIILFSAETNGPIFRVPAAGGETRIVTRVNLPQERSHRYPQFLPDGRHFLYYVIAVSEVRGVYVGDIDGSESHRLLDADAAAVYVPVSERLLFVRQGILFAQNFDPQRLVLTGNPSAVAEQVAFDGGNYVAALSASTSGLIVYRSGAGNERQFLWLDRSGKEIEKVGGPDGSNPQNPSLSPDGRYVGMFRNVNGNQDVWLLELGRTVLTRFTSDAASDQTPIWSPDGSRIVFTSSRKGAPFDLYIKSTTGTGNEELLLATPQVKGPTDWSSDGKVLLYRSSDPKHGYDLWALPIDGDPKPFPVVQTGFDERDGQFSPDGKWIAYQSDESGPVEVYVQPFPGPGRRIQISTGGGAQVRWRRDGKELFYIGLDERLMAVPIHRAANGQTLEPDAPIPLFPTHIGGALQGTSRQQYVVSSDGQRFLMNNLVEQAIAPITVILNWKAKQ